MIMYFLKSINIINYKEICERFFNITSLFYLIYWPYMKNN